MPISAKLGMLAPRVSTPLAFNVLRMLADVK